MKKTPLILIIDDNPINVKLLEIILKKEGYRTISATNGPDGRHLAEKQHPDLILLDIMMPGEDGFDTCKQLSQRGETTDIPIIFISAVEDTASKVKGLNIGAVDYITKPFERAEVLARIRIHLKLKLANKAIIEEQAARLNQIHEAQDAILVKPEEIPEANFAVTYVSVLEAGGDFYSVFSVGEDIFGYFVADISGHDISTSFTTAALNALLNQNANPMYTPVETMKTLNILLKKMLNDGQHITACYAHLNRPGSILSIVSAGHPPVIYINANGDIDVLENPGDILGAFDRVSFNPIRVRVSKGDRFFLYSDGIIEGFGENKKSREQGIKELVDACCETCQISVTQAVEKIMMSLFPGDTKPEDDIVLLGVEV